jgi:hypothetical protein
LPRQYHNINIIDVTKNAHFNEYYLYRCLSPIPFRLYKRRREYLELAIPRGLHKKILFLGDAAVGQIEYGPQETSPYPIYGENIVVMNCIWVLRRAKGYRLGQILIDDMKKSEFQADGFATIGLSNHWSGWLKKEHMEFLGFKSIDSIKVVHKVKHSDKPFEIHLMWLQNNVDAELPRWKIDELLKGVFYCMAHPLYHSKQLRIERIFRIIE